ncbi:unnamed protein product [Prorocentrum cordatum]|uniref:Ribosome biogenesis protein NOP53 n=1 Tax=Prorocentrum cordatum TaxID=2364126 RepID=A0ABN9VM16_9DINO|nr:unnamed protein product [Polarella glacialis]
MNEPGVLSLASRDSTGAVDTTEEPAELVQADTTEEPAELVQADTTEEPAELVQADTTEEPAELVQADTTEEPAELVQADTTEEPAELVRADTTEEPAALVKIKPVMLARDKHGLLARRLAAQGDGSGAQESEVMPPRKARRAMMRKELGKKQASMKAEPENPEG